MEIPMSRVIPYLSLLFAIFGVIAAQTPSASPSRARASVNIIFTVAGSSSAVSSGTGGSASSMTFATPKGVWEDSMGVFYVSESGGHCVRSFLYPNGIVANVAGVCGSSGSTGDKGPATSAKLYNPFFLCGDTLGTLYIDDFSNNRIRSVSDQIIKAVSGSGTLGTTGNFGPATSATMSGPAGIWLDTLSRLYVASQSGNSVRRIDPDSGLILPIAG